MSGQPHTVAALPLGEELLLPIEQEAGWTSELVWMFYRRQFLLLLGIKPWIIQSIAIHTGKKHIEQVVCLQLAAVILPHTVLAECKTRIFS
jgi:hypothetical protein